MAYNTNFGSSRHPAWQLDSTHAHQHCQLCAQNLTKSAWRWWSACFEENLHQSCALVPPMAASMSLLSLQRVIWPLFPQHPKLLFCIILTIIVIIVNIIQNNDQRITACLQSLYISHYISARIRIVWLWLYSYTLYKASHLLYEALTGMHNPDGHLWSMTSLPPYRYMQGDVSFHCCI